MASTARAPIQRIRLGTRLGTTLRRAEILAIGSTLSTAAGPARRRPWGGPAERTRTGPGHGRQHTTPARNRARSRGWDAGGLGPGSAEAPRALLRRGGAALRRKIARHRLAIPLDEADDADLGAARIGSRLVAEGVNSLGYEPGPDLGAARIGSRL